MSIRNRIITSLAVASAYALLFSAATQARADATTAAPADPPADASRLMMTAYGPVQGASAHDPAVTMWLGIPYAAPPVGELRWRAPQPPPSWTQTRAASAFGNPCAQVGSMYGPPAPGKAWGLSNVETFGQPVGSEDCLTLNIWRPADAAGPLPVLLFVHGGAGIFGFSADPLYDGANLAKTAQVVVVTINYRLGFFGSFVHPALTGADAASQSGNFATLDVIQSLRFVHDNIARFGGDPRKVTLMGQSAGGLAVYDVMASPLADELYQQAIVLSGVIGKSSTREKGWAYSQAFTAQLVVIDGLAPDTEAATRFIAAKDPAWVRSYLMNKSANDLLKAIAAHYRDLPWMPTHFGDGSVLPPDLHAAYDEGRFHRVPMIIGVTRDEARLLTPSVFAVDDRQRLTMMLQPRAAGAAPLTAADLLKPYFLASYSSAPYDTYMSVMTRMLVRMADGGLKKVSRHEASVYAYRFDWNRGPEPWKTIYGAAHGIDLPFVFGNFSNNFFAMDFTEQNRAGREALSSLMMRSIGAFLRSGNPDVPGLPSKWQPWSADGGTKLIFDASDSSVCGAQCAE